MPAWRYALSHQSGWGRGSRNVFFGVTKISKKRKYEMIDYEKFVLTEKEEKVFFKFEKTDAVNLEHNEYELLWTKRLVDDINTDFPAIVHISRYGKELRTVKRKQKRKQQIDNRKYLISIFISIFALIISGYTMYSNNIEKHNEYISISNAEELDYFFDGEKLTKEISFIISNNSQVNVSLTHLSIKRGGEYLDINYPDEGYKLPINLSTCNSVEQKVYIVKQLNEQQVNMITHEFGTGCIINTYELNTFLECGENINKGTTVRTRPGLGISIETSKGNVFDHYTRSGASMSW